eukprot:250721_1
MTDSQEQLELTINDNADANAGAETKDDDKPLIEAKYDSIKDIHCRDRLYFVYDKKTINGPYSSDQIISLFIACDLSTTVHVKSAVGGEWHPLHLPTTSGALDPDTFIAKNEPIQNKLSHLYQSLKDIAGKAKQIQRPASDDIPDTSGADSDDISDTEKTETKSKPKRKSFFLLILHILGKILAVIMMLVVILHMFPGLVILSTIACFSACAFFLFKLCCKCEDSEGMKD